MGDFYIEIGNNIRKYLTIDSKIGMIVGSLTESDKINSCLRKCRNWQTSKTKDLVAAYVVRVQVPSSARR